MVIHTARQETETLWQQHTQETGQAFAHRIFVELWQNIRGQACKLKESPVHWVMAAILSGADDESDIPTDDIQYVSDLGFIATRPETRIANRPYRETIPRTHQLEI